MQVFITPKVLGDLFARTDLVTALPMANPGSGKPWFDTSGLMRVGAGASGTFPYIPTPTPVDGIVAMFDGLGGLICRCY